MLITMTSTTIIFDYIISFLYTDILYMLKLRINHIYTVNRKLLNISKINDDTKSIKILVGAQKL